MITLIGQTKGGVGKSMLTANLATYVAHEGRKVLIIDADRQQTSGRWASVRTIEKVKPVIACAALNIDTRTDAKGFAQKVRGLANEYDEIILDCGGHDSRELRTSLAIANYMIAPARPSQADLWGLGDLDTLVGQVEAINPDLTAKIVLNLADPLNFHNAAGQAIEIMDELEALEFGGVTIVNRPTFASAFQDGHGVRDLNQSASSASKATADIAALYNLVYGG